MRYDLDAFYVVSPQPYDENFKDYKRFRIRYPNGAFPADHSSFPEFISLVPSGEMMFFTSWNSVASSTKDISRQRVRVTVVHKGGITDVPQYRFQRPYLERDTMSVYLAIDSSSSNKKKKSKQEKLIEAHLANERQKIRDYADELPALLSYARALLLLDELQRKEKAKSLKKIDRYAFEIGDQVWFSMPLRTDKQGREDSQIKKFQFRWSGPMRVIARSADFNRYTVVEVLPDGRLLSRQANAARLRPYHIIPPKDSADKAAKGVVDDDFAQEIELWKKFAVLQRRPRMKVAEGVNRELFKRFDSDVAEGQYDDPEFYVERLENHTLENGKEYEYKVKWLGQGPYQTLGY
ncbi:hypothetical protein BC829DRAFT_455868 [Chytridium lagenaria]|nr:hypothetical protein BC829DRAFT_455868 [Chytridium lagenaria]